MSEIVRNSQGTRIGTLIQEGSKTWIRNVQDKRLGFYDANSNETRDNNQRRIGTGNQLMSLLS